MHDHDPTNATPPDPASKPASKPAVRLWLTLDEAKDLVGVSDCHAFSDLAQAEKFTTSGQNGDTEFLRSDLMAYKARVAAKAAAEEKAKEAEKKTPDAPPTGPAKTEDVKTHEVKCPCGCRARARASAKVGDIHVHLPPAPAHSEEKPAPKMAWWLIPVVILGTLLGLWLIKGLVSGTSKETAAVPAAAKGEVDTAKAATVDPDATTPPPAAKAVDEEARAAVKVAQETAKNAALVAERAAADLKVHAADAEARWASQTEKNSELDAGIDAATALAVTVKEPVVNPPEPSVEAAPVSLTAEQSAALTEFVRTAKFAAGWAKQGRSRLVVGAEQQIAGSPSYQTLKSVGAARIRAEVPAALVPREFLDSTLLSLQIQ